MEHTKKQIENFGEKKKSQKKEHTLRVTKMPEKLKNIQE